MIKRLLFFFVFTLQLLFISCGTGVGNPGPDQAIDRNLTEADFINLQKSYVAYDISADAQGVDCGSFDQNSSAESIAAAESCIRNSLTSCHLAKYHIDIIYEDQTRLASFVSVVKTDTTCKLYVTTLSTHTDTFYGRYQDNCESVDVSADLKFACR